MPASKITLILPTNTKNQPNYQPTAPSWYNTTWHEGGAALNLCSHIHNDKNRMNRWFSKSGSCWWCRDNYVLYPQFKKQNWQQSQPPTLGLERIKCVGNETDFLSLLQQNKIHVGHEKTCTTKNKLWCFITVAQKYFDTLMVWGGNYSSS